MCLYTFTILYFNVFHQLGIAKSGKLLVTVLFEIALNFILIAQIKYCYEVWITFTKYYS